MIKEVRHVGITVSNMDMSLKFYRDLLGFKEKRIMNESGSYIDNMLNLENVKVKTVKLDMNDTVCLIELLEFQSHPRIPKNPQPILKIGTSHFALTVENLDELYQNLKQNGIKFNSEPQYSPDGYAKVVFCYDPDGTLIELVEVLNENVLIKKNEET